MRLDEPLGQNDGSVKGTVIFECPPGYGAFVRGENIKVGDYPERDELLDSDDDEANGKKDEEEDEI